MPSGTVTKAITYSDNETSVSFNLGGQKIKKFKDAYRRVIHCPTSATRDLFILNDNPDYDRFKYLQIFNAGDNEARVRITSGGANVELPLPAGRMLEWWNIQFWNDDSSTDPDEMDGIYIVATSEGDVTASIEALI